MESKQGYIINDFSDFKSRISSSLYFIDILLESEAKRVGKNREHLLNIYNKTDDKEAYIARLKNIILKLVIMTDTVNFDMNNFNNYYEHSVFVLYPQISIDYLKQIPKDEFLSWFNIVIKNHINITLENIDIIDIIQENSIENYIRKQLVKNK